VRIRHTITALMALALAACQAAPAVSPGGGATATSGATPAAGTTAPATPAAKTTLTFLTGFTGGDRPAYEELIRQFNSSQPNIEVKMDIQPWDTIKQKTPAAMATGSGPDLVTPDFNPGTIVAYAKAGTILPLDEAYGSGAGKIESAAIPPSVLEGFKWEGKLYAAPANFATLLLYHNKKMLQEAGLNGPPKTIDEFRSYASKLTKKDGSQYGLVLADHATIPMWPILIWAEGGDILDDQGCSALDEPATISAVSKWADLVVKEKITPVGLTGQEADNLFAAGKAAMEMNGPWATGAYTPAGIDYDVAPIPVGSAGPVTLAAAVPIVVNKNVKDKAAAYEFLSWWTGQEAQRYLALNSGFPPARVDMANDAELAKHQWVPKFAAAAPHARLYLAGVEHFNEIDADVFTPAIGRITRGESAETVLKEAAQKSDELTGCAS
jgi:multiple sugar transport system substrate-binding protein